VALKNQIYTLTNPSGSKWSFQKIE
jgi:hypothetical protein